MELAATVPAASTSLCEAAGEYPLATHDLRSFIAQTSASHSRQGVVLSVGKGHSRGSTGIEMWWHGGGPGPREAANDGTSGPAAQASRQPTGQTQQLMFWHSSAPHNTTVGHRTSHGTRATDHSLPKRKKGCTTAARGTVNRRDTATSSSKDQKRATLPLPAFCKITLPEAAALRA